MQRTADNPIQTTDWEDVQYQFGNRVGKYETHEAEILMQKEAQLHLNNGLESYNPEKEKEKEKAGRQAEEEEPTEGKGEDDSDEELDDLEKLRQKRMLELKQKMADDRFGVLKAIPGKDYVKEVTVGSEKNWVVALLVQPGHSDCEALLTAMRTVALKHRFVKFVSMIYTEAVDMSFPLTHLPCVVMYHEGKLQHQLTGGEPWKERRDISVAHVERVLLQKHVLPPQSSDDDDSD